jgi:hypothetical protein
MSLKLCGFGPERVRNVRLRVLLIGSALAITTVAGCAIPNAVTYPAGVEAPPVTESPAPVSVPAVSVAAGERVPVGHKVKFGGWELVLHTTDVDATQKVLSENQFNEPPLPGRKFVISDVTITNAGSAEADPFRLSFGVVGPSDKIYKTFEEDSSCGVVPNDIDRFSRLDPGESMRGNVCASVPVEEISSAAWKVSDLTDFRSDDSVLLSLQ